MDSRLAVGSKEMKNLYFFFRFFFLLIEGPHPEPKTNKNHGPEEGDSGGPISECKLASSGRGRTDAGLVLGHT